MIGSETYNLKNVPYVVTKAPPFPYSPAQTKCANQDLSRLSKMPPCGAPPALWNTKSHSSGVGPADRTGVKLLLLLFIWDAAPITLPEKLRAYPIFPRVSQTSRRIAMKISPDNKLRKRVRKIENKLNLSRMKTTMFSCEKNNEAIKQWTSRTFFIIRHYLNVIYLFMDVPHVPHHKLLALKPHLPLHAGFTGAFWTTPTLPLQTMRVPKASP